jgi:hypothetical protein
MSKSLSQHAVEKINDIMANHSNHVGSQLKKRNPDQYKNHIASDCITMAIWVLKYAFEKSLRPDIARQVGSLGHKGTELAKYLINTHRWSGVYYNPDVNHPYDSSGEHISSYYLQVKKSCTYSVSKVPVSHSLINYEPSGITVSPNIGPTTRIETDYNTFQRIPFGLGMSRGGTHVWLYSYGDVYESHWENNANDGLYTAIPLRNFAWASGIIVIPPDSQPLLNVTKLNCR